MDCLSIAIKHANENASTNTTGFRNFSHWPLSAGTNFREIYYESLFCVGIARCPGSFVFCFVFFNVALMMISFDKMYLMDYSYGWMVEI